MCAYMQIQNAKHAKYIYMSLGLMEYPLVSKIQFCEDVGLCTYLFCFTYETICVSQLFFAVIKHLRITV